MKSIVFAVLALLVIQPAHASAKQLDKAEQLFSVLAKSGLSPLVPFEGATIVEAYEVSCVSTLVGDAKSEITCDLASRPGTTDINGIHLVGLQAKRLAALLHAANVDDGESGSTTPFIRCGKYAYSNVDVNYDCQVATSFGKRH